MSDQESDQEHPRDASTSLDRTKNAMHTPKNSEKSKIEGESLKRKRTPILNRNITLAGMRKDRKEYQEAKLLIVREKLEVQKQKLEAMKVKNLLLQERNELLKQQNASSLYV